MHRLARFLRRWLDSETPIDGTGEDPYAIDWLRCLPFVFLHLACGAVVWVGVSGVAVLAAALFYVTRMFFITAFYHRYFSHRSFKTSRAFQFLGALAGATAVQRGPLWWAAHHRHHHAHSDQATDRHSPRKRGFLYSHMGWLMTRANFPLDRRYVKDWLRFPELRFLNRYDWLPAVAFAVLVYLLGAVLERQAPGLGTGGWQMLIWGFFISTVVLHHLTYTINSLAHRFGRRRYDTGDDSRNSATLAVLTLGEGWHNNHHHYPHSARQGFFWCELDPTYYVLASLARVGLIWDLRPVPARVKAVRSTGGHP